MAHAFSPIPAKSSFGNITQSDYASDYIQNKIAKLAYCNDVRNANCKKNLVNLNCYYLIKDDY